jgi:hypothetical protein
VRLDANFAIWVFTLHLLRVLGLYGGAGPHSPDEWSSLFIAIALWGGSWALGGPEGKLSGELPRAGDRGYYSRSPPFPISLARQRRVRRTSNR